MTTRVDLTDDELAHLDGLCSAGVQAEVTAALARQEARRTFPDLTPAHAGFVADCVTEATTNGQLDLSKRRLRRCALCGTSAGYVLFKSGPRRGKPDTNRPLTLPGFELARRFVSMAGYADLGGCESCVRPVLPVIAEALRGVRAEVPEALHADREPRWRRFPKRACTKCGWTGHEGQMGRLRTILGDGTYPAECPTCGAANTFGHTEVPTADGFTVVEAR